MEYVKAETVYSERRVCRVVGQPRSTQRYEPKVKDDEAPLTRRIVRTCPFDRDAVLLKPGEARRLLEDSGAVVDRFGYCLFFPGFLRGMRRFERALARVPLGGQYYVTAMKRIF